MHFSTEEQATRLPPITQETTLCRSFPLRQTVFRHAFAAAFGDKWEQQLTPDRCVMWPASSHAMTTLLMIFAARVVQEVWWPKAMPAQNIDLAWGIWHTTFTAEELAQWQWSHSTSGNIIACHQPTGWRDSAAFCHFADVLCRAFLYQAWLIATAEVV